VSGSRPSQVTSVVESSRLEKSSGDTTGVVKLRQETVEVVTTNDRSDDEDQEQEEDRKVDDRVADDTSLAQLRLLKRVNGRTDLTTADNVSNESCERKVGTRVVTYLGRSQKSIIE